MLLRSVLAPKRWMLAAGLNVADIAINVADRVQQRGRGAVSGTLAI
jgi:hypothetical protein